MRSALVILLLVGSAHAAGPERVTLKQAIARALTQNARVLDQIEELRRAEAQVAQVRAGALPTLTGAAQYFRFDGAAPVATVPLQTTSSATSALPGTELFSASVTATLPLVAPQRWLQWQRARENARTGALSVGAVKRDVAAVVAGAYLSVITLRRTVELEERARDTARAHADYTLVRLRGGIGSRLDDVRAHQELEADEQRVVSARLAQARAQETLGLLLAAGGPVDAAEDPTLPTLDAADDDADAEAAGARRIDMRTIAARRQLRAHVLRDSWSDYMPTLTASFTPSYLWPSTPASPAYSWQFQLALTVPLWDGGLASGLTRERRALARQAAIDEDAALRQLRSELRIGSEAVKRTAEALTRARAAARLAHEAVQIAELAFRAGATTNIELLDAERRARDADTAATIAEDARRQAQLDLLFAAGLLP